MVQWLGLHAFPAEGGDLILVQGTKIPQSCVMPKKRERERAIRAISL